jgi:hypothetical protein
MRIVTMISRSVASGIRRLLGDYTIESRMIEAKRSPFHHSCAVGSPNSFFTVATRCRVAVALAIVVVAPRH